MARSEEPVVLEFSCDIREPYMGNTIPIKAQIFIQGGKIVKVFLINSEGMRTLMKLERRFIMKKVQDKYGH